MLLALYQLALLLLQISYPFWTKTPFWVLWITVPIHTFFTVSSFWMWRKFR